MSSSPTLACSRWCSSSRASGARLFSPAWPAARNWSRHWEARAAVIPNSRDTDSRSSPRRRRSTVARLRRAENRPLRSRSAAAPVALRALSAAVDSSTCFLISTLLLRELSRNHVSKKTLGRRSRAAGRTLTRVGDADAGCCRTAVLRCQLRSCGASTARCAGRTEAVALDRYAADCTARAGAAINPRSASASLASTSWSIWSRQVKWCRGARAAP